MPEIALNLVDRGDGHPAIVFIHGFTCNLSHWREQLSGLSGGHRCIAVDLPGHGTSAEPREATIEALAAAVNDALDALALNQVVLVGHSMGCRLVSETFSQSPARVRGVVYVDGSIHSAPNCPPPGTLTGSRVAHRPVAVGVGGCTSGCAPLR